MKSITIHNMDDNLVQFIEKKANGWDMSLNKTIKKLLEMMKSGKRIQKKKTLVNSPLYLKF